MVVLSSRLSAFDHKSRYSLTFDLFKKGGMLPRGITVHKYHCMVRKLEHTHSHSDCFVDDDLIIRNSSLCANILDFYYTWVDSRFKKRLFVIKAYHIVYKL